MNFRRLVPQDLDSYFSIRLRALAQTPSAFLSTLEEEKERGHARFKDTLAHPGDDRLIFGAFDGPDLIGTLGLYSEERPKLRHKAIVWGVHVDETYRGKSVGSGLLDLAIRHAREKMKAKVMYLSVAPDNPAAQALYESRGFKLWGVEPRAVVHDGQLTDEHHMSLIL